MKTTVQKGSLLAITTVALCALSAGVFAQTPNGYVRDASGNVVRALGYGTCVRTGYWTPALAIAECDPDLVPKPAAAPAKPEAKPAAPAPAPAKPEAKPAAPKPEAKPAAAPVIEKVTLQADALFDFDKEIGRAHV